MSNHVRVRYAPSPTGDPHVGNIRTALFNWLYARHTGGAFILRIEDTDQARATPGALEAIYESLRWLGLAWDEGPDKGGPHAPYVQSQRLPLYHQAAERLLDQSTAYHCYCTPAELEAMRRRQQEAKQPPRYDRRCRQLSEKESKARLAAGLPRVVRFKTPLEGPPVVVHDLVRGEVAFEVSVLDDFVLLKSDGFPTYHLANVVDDHTMYVTHVLRAEEWLPSTPRHLLLYQALSYDPPLLGHLPIILGPDRSKLSKRHGATSLLEYRQEGILPDAMFNFLALLGWSLDEKTEIISRSDLVRHFSLERIVKSAAIFNGEKLLWMNGMYLRQLPPDELARHVLAALEDANGLPPSVTRPLDSKYVEAIIPLVRDRLKTLKVDEVRDLCSFFFLEPPHYDVLPPAPKGMEKAAARRALEATLGALEPLAPFTPSALEGVLRPLAERLSVKTGELFGAIRLAVTGRAAAPPLFDTLAVLGRERVLARLRHVLSLLG
ncbi:MAG: glutamate--tRNA ligase [Chloroflexi bacterium]|nr:glutamate--tRNA ligase [Chloroflexota bacterium]